MYAMSTAAMVRLGRVEGNRMTHLKPVSDKLRRRAAGIISQLGGVDLDTAQRLIVEHQGSVPDALDAARRSAQTSFAK